MGSGSTVAQVPRAGNEYILEWGPALKTLATLGLYVRPWITVDYWQDAKSVGRFESDFFDPVKWRPEYPNPAFDNMRADDAFWGARLVARLLGRGDPRRSSARRATANPARRTTSPRRLIDAARQGGADLADAASIPLVESTAGGGRHVDLRERGGRRRCRRRRRRPTRCRGPGSTTRPEHGLASLTTSGSRHPGRRRRRRSSDAISSRWPSHRASGVSALGDPGDLHLPARRVTGGTPSVSNATSRPASSADLRGRVRVPNVYCRTNSCCLRDRIR